MKPNDDSLAVLIIKYVVLILLLFGLLSTVVWLDSCFGEMPTQDTVEETVSDQGGQCG